MAQGRPGFKKPSEDGKCWIIAFIVFLVMLFIYIVFTLAKNAIYNGY